MKLNEKIYDCRKRAGLSQGALAERIGVSRQAVSKWETGEAEPELAKLRLLSAAFGVTTDWLLSEEEPPQEPTQGQYQESFYEKPHGQADGQSNWQANGQNAAQPSWVDSIPGAIGRLLRRYGWLFGVYLAAGGALFAGIGLLARTISINMMSSFESAANGLMGPGGFGSFGSGAVLSGGGMSGFEDMFPAGTVFFDEFGNQLGGGASGMAANNPVAVMGTAVMVFGLVMLVAGVVLAVYLKRRGRETA